MPGDVSEFTFTEDGPWEIQRDQLGWTAGIELIREATRKSVPRLTTRRGLPPIGRLLVVGYRAQTASLDFHVTGETGTLPLELTLDKSQIKPGGKLAITLRNPRSNEVQVTLAVVDDAARALVPEITAAASPNSEGWLGLLNSWSVPDWFALGNWPRQPEEHAGRRS